MTPPLLAEIPVESAADLTDRWATVLAPPRFAARSLWLLWLAADRRMLPVVVPVDDLPPRPDPATTRGLLALHDAVVDGRGAGEGHLALALCRPGRPVVTAEDDDWAEALAEAFDGPIGGTWSLHLAAGGRVVPLVHPPARAWRR